MILVALGTQDKKFNRLLEMIDTEISNGNIKDSVVVQAGKSVNYKTNNMQLFSIIPIDEFNNLLKKCDLLITHGGVGTIIQGLKYNKRIIAIPRLKKYKEHTNDHQKQIVDKFSKDGYILACNDQESFKTMIKKIKNFTPKNFVSNKNNFVDHLKKIIDMYI